MCSWCSHFHDVCMHPTTEKARITEVNVCAPSVWDLFLSIIFLFFERGVVFFRMERHLIEMNGTFADSLKHWDDFGTSFAPSTTTCWSQEMRIFLADWDRQFHIVLASLETQGSWCFHCCVDCWFAPSTVFIFIVFFQFVGCTVEARQCIPFAFRQGPFCTSLRLWPKWLWPKWDGQGTDEWWTRVDDAFYGQEHTQTVCTTRMKQCRWCAIRLWLKAWATKCETYSACRK